MIQRDEILRHFAHLIDYPQDSILTRLSELLNSACEIDLQVSEKLVEFQSSIESDTLETLQENHIHTFAHNPKTALEVGWHLYGERYERGAFLVMLRGELREHGITESTELPDYLPQVLLLLASMNNQDAVELADKYMLPAIKKIEEGIQKIDSPYVVLVHALKIFLELEFCTISDGVKP